VTQPLGVLVVTTVTTAALHTLIPDHWLPFVLVARSQGWSARRTAALTTASAALHVVVSVGLGVAAHLLGRGAEAAVGVGESLSKLSAGLLVLFGAAYALWFLGRGGHQHSFGMHPHHGAETVHPPATPHPHDLAEAAAAPPPAGRDRRRGRLGGASLAVIVGFNPCILVIPYVYMAGTMGTGSLLLVGAAFAGATVTCMVGVALLGLKGTARLESPFLTRYGEAVSGVLIALTGLVVMFSGA
jgi:ABC-type nickel/cobalt efflux system permease component RcnA